MMDMVSTQRKKNLIVGEDETPHEKETPSTPQSLSSYLDQMGVDWEKRGKAVYIYPSSLNSVKEILSRMPNPAENEYAIIPLGSASGYTVFIMVTKSSVTMRIGYGRNSIPFSPSLMQIMDKVEKVAKEIGIESRKNGRNLIEV